MLDIAVQEPNLQPYPKFDKYVYDTEINKTFALPVNLGFENAYYSRRSIQPQALIVYLRFSLGLVTIPNITGVHFLLGGLSSYYTILTCGIMIIFC